MKCLRTMLTLDILGKLGLFDSIFDIDYFHRIKKYYIGKVISIKGYDEFAADIYNLMLAKRYPIPIYSRFFAFFYSFYVYLIPKSIHKVILKKFRTK